MDGLAGLPGKDGPIGTTTPTPTTISDPCFVCPTGPSGQPGNNLIILVAFKL